MVPEAEAIPAKRKKRHVRITCPMCGKEWNVHDAERELMELEA